MALRDEARAALPALKAVADHRAGLEGVKAVVGKRFALFPQPERLDGEWAAWWEDYADVLADVPLACLEAAMRAWVAKPDALFLPKPGELRDLAFRTVSRSLRRYQRAKRALDLYDTPQLPGPAAPEGVHDPEAVKRMFADYQAQLGTVRGMRRVELPSIAGKADAGGLTPQMRALLSNQAEGR